MKPKIVKTKQYEASNGKIFCTKHECLQHENEVLQEKVKHSKDPFFKNFSLDSLLVKQHHNHVWSKEGYACVQFTYSLEIKISGDISINNDAFYMKFRPHVTITGPISYFSESVNCKAQTFLTFDFYPEDFFNIETFLKKIDDYQTDHKKEQKVEDLARTLWSVFSSEISCPYSKDWSKYKDHFPQDTNAWRELAKKLINKEIAY